MNPLLRLLAAACTVGLLPSLVPAADLQGMIRRYHSDQGYLRGVYDTDLDQDGIKRLRTFYQSWEQRLREVDYDALTHHGQVDYHLLKNHAGAQLRDLVEQEKEMNEDVPFLPFSDSVLALHENRKQGRFQPGSSAAQALQQVLEGVKQGRKAFEQHTRDKKDNDSNEEIENIAPPPDPGSSAEEEQKTQDSVLGAGEVSGEGAVSGDAATQAGTLHHKLQALRLAGKVKRLQKAVEDWYNHYANFQPGFDWWVKKNWETVKKDLEEYEKFLREKKAGVKDPENAPLMGEAVGEEVLDRLIREQFIPYTARELIAIGEREFAWCEEEMKKAAEQLGFDDWKKGLEQVKDIHVAPGRQAELVSQ